ncbi:MAG: hypothetical protein R3D66_01870, partial [Alphaproteobacteria bacterium]
NPYEVTDTGVHRVEEGCELRANFIEAVFVDPPTDRNPAGAVTIHSYDGTVITGKPVKWASDRESLADVFNTLGLEVVRVQDHTNRIGVINAAFITKGQHGVTHPSSPKGRGYLAVQESGGKMSARAVSNLFIVPEPVVKPKDVSLGAIKDFAFKPLTPGQ